MRRNNIDAADAVDNAFTGTGGNDRFVGTAAGGEEFSGEGGSDRFLGNGGDDTFVLDGADAVIAAADDGTVAEVIGFNDGNNRINFRDFDAASIDDVIFEENANGTSVSVAGSQTYNLQGVAIDDLNEDDFFFSADNNANAGEDDGGADEDVAEEEQEAPGDLNTDINVLENGRTLVGTDGNDLIDANDFDFNGGGFQTIRADFGADTIITSTQPGSDTVAFLGSFGLDAAGNDQGRAK